MSQSNGIDSEKVELISVNEFAKRVGVDEKSIREHIRAGRFQDGYTQDSKGRRKINYAVALAEWQAFGGGFSYRTPDGGLQPKDPTVDAGKRRDGSIPGRAESEKKQAYYKAEAEELKYKELSGELVRRDDVYKELFTFGAEVRKALLSVPDRIVDAVMAAKSRGEAHALLFDEIEKALLNLTDEKFFEKKFG